MEHETLTDLGRCWEAHAAALVLYARHWLDAASAEDAVQEVFVRLLSHPRPASLKAWLFRSVRNAAISRLRSQRRREGYEGRSDRPGWFEPQPGQALDAAAAEAALQRLPEEQREIIVLRIWGGLTLEEAAEATGQPVSTLFSRYRAGLAGLRGIIERSSSCLKD
jgi:RNA polymerase sigma factor (sigma-70 family)